MSASMKSANLEVTGLGLCTPLGLQANVVPYEINSGIVRFIETSRCNANGEAIRASQLTLIDEKASRTERMAVMAATAFEDCMTGMPPMRLSDVPVFLALPRVGEGASYSANAIVAALDSISDTMQLGTLSRAVLVQEGRGSFFRALELATERLLDIDAPMVIVGAIDSMCDAMTLDVLAMQNRVLGEGNRDGIIPGEAAGFITLTNAGDRTALGQSGEQAATRIIAVATANEPRPFLYSGSRQGGQSEALTQVFAALRADANVMTLRSERLFSCQTSEEYWAQEFINAYLRNAPLLPEPLITHLISQSLGDVGASAGLIQVAQGAHMLINEPRGKGSGRRALVYGCSDHGLVGACIVEVFGGTN